MKWKMIYFLNFMIQIFRFYIEYLIVFLYLNISYLNLYMKD